MIHNIIVRIKLLMNYTIIYGDVNKNRLSPLMFKNLMVQVSYFGKFSYLLISVPGKVCPNPAHYHWFSISSCNSHWFFSCSINVRAVGLSSMLQVFFSSINQEKTFYTLIPYDNAMLSLSHITTKRDKKLLISLS